MFRDALTLWQLEWKRCKWLWTGVIILMAAGQAMLKLPQENMPGFLKWCPLGLAFLSPLFFSGAIASILVRNRLPILLTLPVKSRGIYWIYYFGALILCFLFASTLCLTQVFSFVDLLLGVSLLFLIHSVVFWSALLHRDGNTAVPGLLMLFVLYFAAYPLIPFLSGFFLALPLSQIPWESGGLPAFPGFSSSLTWKMVDWYFSIPVIAMVFGIVFTFSGALLWSGKICSGRNIHRPVVLFLLLLLPAPFLLTLGGYAALTGMEWVFHRHWEKRFPVQRDSSCPEFYKNGSGHHSFYRRIKGSERTEVIPEKVLEYSRRITREGQNAKRISIPSSKSLLNIPEWMNKQEWEKYLFSFGFCSGYDSIFLEGSLACLNRKQWGEAEEILRGYWDYLNFIEPQNFYINRRRMFFLFLELISIPPSSLEDPGMLPVLRTLLKELERFSLIPADLSPPYRSFSDLFPFSWEQDKLNQRIRSSSRSRFTNLFIYSALVKGNREIRKAAECRTEEELARFVKTLSGPNALSGLLSVRAHHVTGCYYLKVLGIAQLKYWIAALEGKKAPELPAHLTIRNGIVHDEITGLYFKLYFKERTR